MNIEEIVKELQNWVSEDSERHVYFAAVEHPQDLSKISHGVYSSGDMRAVAATMVAASMGSESFTESTGALLAAMDSIMQLKPDEIMKSTKKVKSKIS